MGAAPNPPPPPPAEGNGTDIHFRRSTESNQLDLDDVLPYEYLAAAAALSGKPPPARPDRETLLRTHMTHVRAQQKSIRKLQKGAAQAGDPPPPPPKQVKKPILALAYPASTKGLGELSTMRLDEMLVESHHMTRRLLVRTLTDPFHGTGITVVVEDEWGGADKLAIYHRDDFGTGAAVGAGEGKGLQKGSVLAVREPYYRFNQAGDYMVCVDHPSDVVLLGTPGDWEDGGGEGGGSEIGELAGLVPEKWKKDFSEGDTRGEKVIGETDEKKKTAKTAAECVDEGDKAFIAKDLRGAVSWYTRAVAKLSKPACGSDSTAANPITDGDDSSGSTPPASSPPPAPLLASVLAKRAGTNLALRRYDAARADALASRVGGDGAGGTTAAASDWRAYFTAARAEYALASYASSAALLEKAAGCFAAGGAASPPAVVTRELERARARVGEERTGVYDLAALEAGLKLGVPDAKAAAPKKAPRGKATTLVDVASFTANTRVGPSAKHGRGLFAVRDIAAGDIVFVEKACCVPQGEYNVEFNAAALFAQLVELCRDNPTWHRRVLGLTAGDDMRRSGREGDVVDERLDGRGGDGGGDDGSGGSEATEGMLEVDGGGEPKGADMMSLPQPDATPLPPVTTTHEPPLPVLDIYIIEAIRRKNCFAAPHSSLYASYPQWNLNRDGLAKGLWLQAAYANHACLPNTNRSFVGDLLVSRASVDIRAGDEILQIYLPPKVVYTQRRDQFGSWGFACACGLCAAEARSPDARHAAREAALAALEADLGRKPAGKHQPDAVIRGVERAARRLEALYEAGGDGDVYRSLPRLALVWPSMWLTEAYRTRKKHARSAAWAMQVLRNFGWIEPLRAEEGGGAETLNVYGVGVGELGHGAEDAMRTPQKAITTFECVKALLFAEEAYRALGKEALAVQCRRAAHVGYRTLIGFDASLDDVDL